MFMVLRLNYILQSANLYFITFLIIYLIFNSSTDKLISYFKNVQCQICESQNILDLWIFDWIFSWFLLKVSHFWVTADVSRKIFLAD